MKLKVQIKQPIKMNKLENGQEKTIIIEKDVFIKIITSPREAFRFINDYKYEKHLYILLCFGGIVRAFDRATSKNMGDHFSILAIILICIFSGGLFGWISYYIYASLMSWCGGWFNARGNPKSILRILAYALFPSILGLVILIPQILIYGNEIFKSQTDIDATDLINFSVFYALIFIEVMLSIWSFILIIIGISEVQKLSIGKSILIVLLPAVLIISFGLILFLLFDLIN
jgi:hypothetical protein